MILLRSNFPFAQGVFTAILVSVFVFVFKLISKGLDKTIDKTYLSSKNINKLLRFALLFNQKGQIDDSIQAYKKVLEIEPFNSMALISLGYINFQQQNFEEAQVFYSKIYDYYFVSNPTIKNNLDEKPKALLYIALYRYGYILNKKGLIEKGFEFKKLSLENKYFVDNYNNLRSEIAY